MSVDSKDSLDSANVKSNLSWKECFQDAIEYFTTQIDNTIYDQTEVERHSDEPSTPRDYYQERGWSNETIERHCLGWAPAKSENQILSYLQNKGYNTEEILATGLFRKNLSPLWYGRFVFPYVNEEGIPEYAISREIDGGHPDDYFAGKYAKPAHTKEYAEVSEPIFGLHSISAGEPVIITEGIADAITVQQAGYPCVSPVTTQFNRNDLNTLVDFLTDNNIPRVYVVQDAERPSNELNADQGWPSIEQFGPGVMGAVKTAIALSENGIQAFVNTPPRFGLRKVDVDDYIRDGWGTVEALLRSARPVHQHPAYAEFDKSPIQSFDWDRSPSPATTGSQSGLFRLNITDVTGLPVGFRGKNPLGHTGHREDYFAVFDEEWAYDHKRKVEYNPLTYLLCESGKRRLEEPGGSLSDEEYFVAWKFAKERGILANDDPLPHRGLIHAAVDNDLCSPKEIEDGWKLPPSAYDSALELVVDEYGLNPARDPIGGYPEIPGAQDLQNLPSMTLDEARQRCQDTIEHVFNQNRFFLLNALPAQGKSYNIIKMAAKFNAKLTVFIPRWKLFDEDYKGWCEKYELTYHRFPSFHDDCPCAAGEHGKEWENKVKAIYDNGATGAEIHQWSEKRFGQKLPCQKDGHCSLIQKWDFEPDDYDVLFGFYTHAYREEISKDRIVAIDESPTNSFLQKFKPTDVRIAIDHYINQHENFPFEGYTDLIENRSNDSRFERAIEWFDEQNPEVKREGFTVMSDETGKAHALAPLMVYGLLVGEDLGNGWEHASLPNARVLARDRAPDDTREEAELVLLLPPPLDVAENVIALDGTPLIPHWEMCLGLSVEHMKVLDGEERTAYLRDALNLEIYQMDQGAKSYSGGHWVKLKDDAALIKQLRESEGSLPYLISTKRAIAQYKEADLLKHVAGHEHYSNLNGMNRFSDVDFGIVIGSNHYGDKYIKMWGALAGESVERLGDGNSEDKGMNLDYGDFGNKILHHKRELQTLQSILRYGRNEEQTKVFVSTAAIPEWVPIAGNGQVKKWSDGMIQVVEAVSDRDEWRTKDLLFEMDGKSVLATDDPEPISERQVRRLLKKLNKYQFIDKRKEGNGWLWMDKDLHAVHTDRQVLIEQ